jgi:MYXO-CTERM domain-containing protein
VSDSAGNTDCTDADPVSYCLPPYWEQAVTAADSAGDFEATRGGEEQNSGGGVSSPLDNLPPAAEAAAGGGTATDGGGGASTRSSDGGESGCSAAATGAGLGSMLLTMFGLVGLRRRRTTR